MTLFSITFILRRVTGFFEGEGWDLGVGLKLEGLRLDFCEEVEEEEREELAGAELRVEKRAIRWSHDVGPGPATAIATGRIAIFSGLRYVAISSVLEINIVHHVCRRINVATIENSEKWSQFNSHQIASSVGRPSPAEMIRPRKTYKSSFQRLAMT